MYYRWAYVNCGHAHLRIARPTLEVCHVARKAGVDWYVGRAGRAVVRSNGQLCRQVCKEGVWLLRAGVADKYERRPPTINCA